VVEWAHRVAYSAAFTNFILAVIVLTALLIGIETSETLTGRFPALFDALDVLVQTIFVFDFAVVVTSLLPQAGAFAMVARLARLLRVTRLVSVFPELRLIIGTMLRSIPSMGHVIMLLSLLLYVYGILGFSLFREQDPEHWGTLGAALLTLFQMLTLEGWVEIQGAVLTAFPWAWIYFGSFVLVAVFVVVNLFIAVQERPSALEDRLRRTPTSP
jgi:voltage-gated sodium channel